MNPVGLTAALATAVSWAACAMFFTSASRRIGAFSMNNWRVLFGALLLLGAHLAVFGHAVPDATAQQWLLLVTSGVIGVVIGDSFLFQSYLDIGPRLGLLLFNASPLFTALIAWPILGERLKGLAWLGIAVTLAGTLWVVAEENPEGDRRRPRHYARGIAFALLAALGQSIGFIIAKLALTGTDGLDPLSATLIRVSAAVVGFWGISLVRGALPRVVRDFRDRRAMLYLLGGAITGPSVGIWLSLLALKLIPAGIAATLMATMPVAILPLVMIFYREKVSWRAAIGAAITVAGVALLVNS